MLHVLNYTEKVYACTVVSRKDMPVDWTTSGQLKVTINNLPGRVVRAVHGEDVAVGYTKPNGVYVQGEHVRNCLIFQATNVFTLFAEYGIVIFCDNETLYISSIGIHGWDTCLRSTKIVDLAFTPSSAKHKLLATAALEGVAVMVDSFSMIPSHRIQDTPCYTVSQ
jgi:hypothetical protein